jgi:hypothetical protein
MKRRQAGATRKRKKRPNRVLTHTENGFEWQAPSHEDERKPAEDMFERVLSRFGWAISPQGGLEHVGSDSNKAH